MPKKISGRRRITWVNIGLLLPAAVSFYTALRNVFLPNRFQDFQWSGAHLTLHHIDPYQQYLLHDPDHLLLASQIPNYLHELYILLLPFGAPSFPATKFLWTVSNCLFTVVIVHLLGRIYALERAKMVLLASLFLISTPFRIAIASGNEALLALLLFCLVFTSSGSTQRGTALGLSYFKYSFSPVLFLYFLFRRYHKLLAFSFIPPLLGLLFMWFLVGGNPMRLAVEPFMVARSGVAPGFANLMSIADALFSHPHSGWTLGLSTYLLALLACAGCALFLSRQNDLSLQDQAAMLAVASLMCFVHLVYDSVFLIVPLASCLAGSMRRINVFVITAISLIWYGVKVVPVSASQLVWRWASVAAFLLLTAILVLLGHRKQPAPANTPAQPAIP